AALGAVHPVKLHHHRGLILTPRQIAQLALANLCDLRATPTAAGAGQDSIPALPPHPELQRTRLLIDLVPVHAVPRPVQNLGEFAFRQPCDFSSSLHIPAQSRIFDERASNGTGFARATPSLSRRLSHNGATNHRIALARVTLRRGESSGAEPDGEVRSIGTIPNRLESVRKLVVKLAPAQQLRACYEAGPTGYVLYWQLTALGVDCQVIAPALVPTKAGDRVKTDRRDAVKLARCHRAGDLTAVWVPDEAHEALRDLIRAREAAKKDQLRARHRLGKFLLRRGRRPATKMTPWTAQYMNWIAGQVHFDQPAQEATLLDYVHEVEHAAARIQRLEKSIDQAI